MMLPKIPVNHCERTTFLNAAIFVVEFRFLMNLFSLSSHSLIIFYFMIKKSEKIRL